MTPHNNPAKGFLLYAADEVHLAKLRHKIRVLVEEMTNIPGMKYEVLAAKYNIPLGTVKSRIHRGRAAIERMRTIQKEAENESV